MGKRLIVFTTIVVLLSVIGSAALAVSETPIRFRGIEWFTDRATVIETIKDTLDITPSNTSSNLKYSWSKEGEWSTVYLYTLDDEDYTAELDGAGTSISFQSMQVAGFNVKATLRFIDSINPDGTINRDDDASLLYRVAYSFDSDVYPDRIDRFTKLRKALISVYGEPDIDIDGGYTKMAYWEDTEKNKIKLMYTNQPNYKGDFEPSFMFIYEAGGTFKKIVAIEDIYRAEEAARLKAEQDAAEAEREGAGENTDGL